MGRIIQILIKNHVFFLFIFLEFISLKTLISNNFVAESNFSKKITEMRSNIFLKELEIKEYFFLKNQNIKLLESNALLFEKNLTLTRQLDSINSNPFKKITDSIIVLQGKILRNSWNKKQNFITINNGEKNGIKPNLGVVNRNNNFFDNCLHSFITLDDLAITLV